MTTVNLCHTSSLSAAVLAQRTSMYVSLCASLSPRTATKLDGRRSFAENGGLHG